MPDSDENARHRLRMQRKKAADTVTEMQAVKHAFQAGVKAQLAIFMT
ncbi:MAG TPA: cob(I)yrinic acid a,c-diamide adenosyltransferase [Gammaproteobacteria bacterium]